MKMKIRGTSREPESVLLHGESESGERVEIKVTPSKTLGPGTYRITEKEARELKLLFQKTIIHGRQIVEKIHKRIENDSQ